MPVPDTFGAATRLTSASAGLGYLDKDEWIEVLPSRNFIDDLDAEIRAQRMPVRIPGVTTEDDNEDELHREGRTLEEGEIDPDVAELENRQENAVQAVEMEIHEGKRWFNVFNYMCPRFRLYRTASPEDREQGKSRGRKLDDKDPEDRRYVFGRMGKDILPHLLEREGGTPLTVVKKDDGNDLTFPRGRKVRTAGNEETVSSTGT